MTSNDWKERLGMVYSTDPNYDYSTQKGEIEQTLTPKEQNLRVWLDKKQRGGKQVTLIKGFIGSEQSLKELATLLKSRCGVGGAAKDGEIMIQGDMRNRVVEILNSQGYGVKKAGA